MTLKIFLAPATEPVSLAEAKAHLRCGDDEDALITALIQAAREQAEHLLNRSLITQTWERVLDAFPAVELPLGMPPVQSVSSVRYYDPAGAPQTLDPSAYSLDADTDAGWIIPAYGTSWPDTIDTPNAVRVRFVCGYGGAADVPAAIRSWILLRIGTLYKHREETVAGVSLAELPRTFIDGLLDPFRHWSGV